MFNKSLEITLNNAFADARDKRHEFITVEHLLLGLLDNTEVHTVLVACDSNIDRLRAGLNIFIEETAPHLPYNCERDVQPTLSFQRVLQRAIYQVQSTNNVEVTGVHVLLAVFGEPESQGVYFLNQENITRMDILNYTTQGVDKTKPNNFPEIPPARGMDMPQQPSPFEEGLGGNQDSSQELIEMYAVNLNTLAQQGKIDPVIGRQEELKRAMQVLCRRNKNNPLFVGEPGVGKTAVANGLAQLIVDKKVPEPLQNSSIYSLDMGMLLAGTKYRGDFEKRFKSVLKAFGALPGAIVFIDEIHNLIGAGSATGGTMDAANLIKPLLGRGELRCMGATTYDEFRNYLAKDSALMRRFQKIDITETNDQETLQILQGLSGHFEKHHDVRYTKAALVRAIELSQRYLVDHRLPDIAIDIIDEVGANQRLRHKGGRVKFINSGHIERVVAKMARVPIEHLTRSDEETIKQLPRNLKKVVFGQDHAIEALSDSIKLARAGLREVDKPIGSFLLAGPTGVGKTEVTKQLAKQLGVKLLRFDMSEYMEKHSVSRLIGAPPGYVGFDQGGLLTEEVRRHPHSVLLLDEIEKANPELFNILLQVMDYGFLTDNNGKKADFRHCIIAMTTNAGAQSLEKSSIGFSSADGKKEDNIQAIKQIFSPEFRNRLDGIVTFNQLDGDAILKIVDKELRTLRRQLTAKGLTLKVDQEMKSWLAEKGYSSTMGARPMGRLIQEQLKKPLADKILFSKLAKDSIITVTLNKGVPKFCLQEQKKLPSVVESDQDDSS